MNATARKLKEDEVIYGGELEAKIIPISQKARDYLLVNQPPSAKKLSAAVRPSKQPRQNPRLISELYARFVEPHYPTVMRASRQFFLKYTIPFLVNATCANAAVILSAVFYSRHAKTFSDSSKADHMRQTLIAISSHTAPPLPLRTQLAMKELRTERQREALRIIANLASEREDFYLSCRDLQARLLLPTPMTAFRLLERLCQIGCIERISHGMNRQDAKAEGLRPMAATFILKR